MSRDYLFLSNTWCFFGSSSLGDKGAGLTMGKPAFQIEIGTCFAGTAIVWPWRDAEVGGKQNGSPFSHVNILEGPCRFFQRLYCSPGRQHGQLSVLPPRARLPAESKTFQMCESRLRLEVLTGGPERERENARVSVTDARMRWGAGWGNALEEASKNSSAGLRSLCFPGPLSLV